MMVILSIISVTIGVGTIFFPPTPFIVVGFVVAGALVASRYSQWKARSQSLIKQKKIAQIVGNRVGYPFVEDLKNRFTKSLYNNHYPILGTVARVLTSPLWVTALSLDTDAKHTVFGIQGLVKFVVNILPTSMRGPQAEQS